MVKLTDNEKESFDPLNHELDRAKFNDELINHQSINDDFNSCLWFSAGVFSHDFPESQRNFFISLLNNISDIVLSVTMLAENGMSNSCKRELRYLIELCLKAFQVTKNNHSGDLIEQIEKNTSLLKSSNINFINASKFKYLSNSTSIEFKEDLKRLYGRLSNYVHASPSHLNEYKLMYDKGISEGTMNYSSLNKFNSELENIYAICLCLFFHSVPNWVAESYFIKNSDNFSRAWRFTTYKYTLEIYNYFR